EREPTHPALVLAVALLVRGVRLIEAATDLRAAGEHQLRSPRVALHVRGEIPAVPGRLLPPDHIEDGGAIADGEARRAGAGGEREEERDEDARHVIILPRFSWPSLSFTPPVRSRFWRRTSVPARRACGFSAAKAASPAAPSAASPLRCPTPRARSSSS